MVQVGIFVFGSARFTAVFDLLAFARDIKLTIIVARRTQLLRRKFLVNDHPGMLALLGIHDEDLILLKILECSVCGGVEKFGLWELDLLLLAVGMVAELINENICKPFKGPIRREFVESDAVFLEEACVLARICRVKFTLW